MKWSKGIGKCLLQCSRLSPVSALHCPSEIYSTIFQQCQCTSGEPSRVNKKENLKLIYFSSASGGLNMKGLKSSWLNKQSLAMNTSSKTQVHTAAAWRVKVEMMTELLEQDKLIHTNVIDGKHFQKLVTWASRDFQMGCYVSSWRVNKRDQGEGGSFSTNGAFN